MKIDGGAPSIQQPEFEPPKPPPPPPPPPPRPLEVRDGFDAPVRQAQPKPTAGARGSQISSITDTLNGIKDDEQFCKEAGRLLLGRDMEKGAIDGWMEGMKKNGVPRSEIIKLIVTSDEFKARAAQQLTPHRSGIKANIDGLDVIIPRGWDTFGKLDYDPRTITANGGPNAIPDLMWKMAPYVNLMMVENPLKFESERRSGSPAFKEAYQLGRAMEDEFSSTGPYKSKEAFQAFAQSRLDQLASIRSRMDPAIDGPVNFKALDDTMNILKSAMGRAASGGSPSVTSTGQSGTWVGHRNLGNDWQAAMKQLQAENMASPQMTSPHGFYASMVDSILGGIRNT